MNRDHFNLYWKTTVSCYTKDFDFPNGHPGTDVKKPFKLHITGSSWRNPSVLLDSPHKGWMMQKAFPCHDIIIGRHTGVDQNEFLYN